MSDHRPQVGDRVRVVLEADVSDVDGEGIEFDSDEISLWIGPKARKDFVVSIEKIEPPVEVFGPGDVVRQRSHPGNIKALYDESDGRCRWLQVTDSHYPAGYLSNSHSRFTSKHYERVNLS